MSEKLSSGRSSCRASRTLARAVAGDTPNVGELRLGESGVDKDLLDRHVTGTAELLCVVVEGTHDASQTMELRGLCIEVRPGGVGCGSTVHVFILPCEYGELLAAQGRYAELWAAWSSEDRDATETHRRFNSIIP